MYLDESGTGSNPSVTIEIQNADEIKRLTAKHYELLNALHDNLDELFSIRLKLFTPAQLEPVVINAPELSSADAEAIADKVIAKLNSLRNGA